MPKWYRKPDDFVVLQENGVITNANAQTVIWQQEDNAQRGWLIKTNAGQRVLDVPQEKLVKRLWEE